MVHIHFYKLKQHQLWQEQIYLKMNPVFSNKKEWSTGTRYIRHRWTLKTFCCVKAASHNTPCSVWFQLNEMSRTDKSIEAESRFVVSQGWWIWGGGWKWEMTSNENSVSFRDGGSVLKLTVVVIAQFCDYTKNHWILHLKRVNQWIVWDVNWLHWGLY